MSEASAIEWTDATWNPVTGCDRVSPGCAHCYALDLAARLKAMGQARYQNDGGKTSGPGFAVTLHRDKLEQPLRWRKPRRVFVNSMSDLFHEEQVPATFIIDVFNVMREAQQHTFQILTKRPERMANMLRTWPLREHWPNVWLGTSIENRRFVERADSLRLVDPAVRFISAEPLLGPLISRVPCPNGPGCDLCEYEGGYGDIVGGEPWSLNLDGIHWLIVGGESGPTHRPCHEIWVRDLRDATLDNGTAFFFKQWGGRTPKSGGRLLDGRTWDEYPTLQSSMEAAS